jgi:endonuclease III
VAKRLPVKKNKAAKPKAVPPKKPKRPPMPKETPEQKAKRAQDIIDVLVQVYPDAECALAHENPLQLLIATMLSAQTTDARVNMVTPALFAKYETPQEFANAKVPDIEKLIKSVNFYRNKAKNIKAMAQALIERHGGEVPRSMDELVNLAGVGRKTANVVLGNAFEIPGVVVDTHVMRLTNRLGLVDSDDPVEIEHKLMEFIDQKYWTLLAHLLISHGRAICIARKPLCEKCALNKLCPKRI